MRSIIMLFGFLAIIAVAVVGCLYIFDVTSWEASMSLLLKSEAAILLLGGCSALLSMLLGRATKGPQN